MSKIIRLTESDLVRLVKRVIEEQIKKPYMVDDASIYSPIEGYGGGVGYETTRGTLVWLNNKGVNDWPQGDIQTAKNSVMKLIKGVQGVDITGSGAKLIQQVANDWRNMNIETQNEFLKQWYIQTADKTDYGSPWDAINDDNENKIVVQMIVDSKTKVNNYCKSFVDMKNKGQNPNNPICNYFVTDDLRSPMDRF